MGERSSESCFQEPQDHCQPSASLLSTHPISIKLVISNSETSTTSGESPGEGLRLFASRRKQPAREGWTYALLLLGRDNSRDSIIMPTSSTHKPKMWHPFSPELSHQFYSAYITLVLFPSFTSSILIPPGQEDLSFVTAPASFPRANPQRFQKQKNKQYLPSAVPEV